MHTDAATTEADVPASPPTWQEMRRNIRRLARAARDEAKADPAQPGQELLVAVAAAIARVVSAALSGRLEPQAERPDHPASTKTPTGGAAR